jgi:hypothetical protein
MLIRRFYGVYVSLWVYASLMFQLKFKTVKTRIVNAAFDPTFAAVVVEICTLRRIAKLFFLGWKTCSCLPTFWGQDRERSWEHAIREMASP